eukprot:TRINITY_DN2529_c0_g1_i1.p1 TRINITY_DN2529_c0_g1~~TRINITY_DN2529_c0_g1_i1.p1  ORF type:complete len:339 (+),score=81.01 TRINITY_DN2529_c0_g1_i1:112-1128(+)
MLRKGSLDCFGLGFITSNTYFCKWCLPFFTSPSTLMTQFGYSVGSGIKNSIGSSPAAMNEGLISPKFNKNFKFLSSSHKIPHPDKAYTGGEDACFTFEDSAVGVADGVGGWAEVGVDSSIYSNALMNKAKSFFSMPKISLSSDPATDSLQFAYEQCLDITGSSTGIVAAIVGNNVKLCNVGDSRAVLLRETHTQEGLRYKVQEYTVEQTYRFNFPYQLGTNSTTTPKKHGLKYDWSLQDGDYLVLGSDGVFDNLWGDDIASILNSTSDKSDVSKLAQKISLKASEVAEDSYNTKTPWAVGAKKAGKMGPIWTGGKMDDITVVVSKVIGCNTTSLDAKL